MAIDTSRRNYLNTMIVFDGAFTAIWSSPLILGLFLLSGVLRIFLPFLVGLITRLSLMSIGIVIAYQALDGQIRADSSDSGSPLHETRPHKRTASSELRKPEISLRFSIHGTIPRENAPSYSSLSIGDGPSVP
jgi:hypothetical protein